MVELTALADPIRSTLKEYGLSLSEAISQQSGTWVQCGDSNTDPGANPQWQAHVDIEWTGEGAPLHGWTMNNIGGNGSTLATWVGSISTGDETTATDTDNSLWAAINADPDVVSLKLGTNDMGLDSARATSGSEATFRSNLATAVNFILDNSHAAVLLIVPQPFAHEAFGGTVTWADAAEAQTMSERLRALHLEWVGKNRRVTVYDSHKDLFGFKCDDKATECLDPVTGNAMVTDALHCTSLGYRRMAQRIANMMVPSSRKSPTERRIPNAQHVSIAWGLPVYVSATASAGTLLTVLTNPEYASLGQKAGWVDESCAAPITMQPVAESAFAFGRHGGYYMLRSLYSASDVKVFFAETGNTYTCTTFRYSDTTTISGGDSVDRYVITGTTISETGPAVVYVEDMRDSPDNPAEVITVPIERTSPDIFVSFRGKRGMRAELVTLDAARAGGGGVTGSCDVYLITVNNGVTTGTLCASVSFGSSLAFGSGTINATNFPSGVLMDSRSGTQHFGFRFTNFSNFGGSGTEGTVVLGMKYYT